MRLLLLCLACVLSTGCASRHAGQGNKAAVQAGYEQLKERFQSGDPWVDVRQLRHSYMQTANYSPYGATGNALRAVARLANSGDFEGCLEEVGKLEPKAYPTLELHHFGWLCAREMGEAEEAMRHERIARRIFSDIVADGDGKSVEQAWQTISTNELYLVLAINGLVPKSQALVQSDGRVFDLMTVEPEGGGDKEVRYFDITLQMAYGMNLRDE